MGRHPITLQLRYLQTLSEIAVENNSTVIFPLPLDLVQPLLAMQERIRGGSRSTVCGPAHRLRLLPLLCPAEQPTFRHELRRQHGLDH